MNRVAIDPVTRVDGHLRVELELGSGMVQDAWLTGTMYRGLENVLRGRDPRDAWLLAQRICGTCTGVHALASVRAVENALGVRVPTNARLLRNLILGATLVQQHVMQFYLHALPDWVDASAALVADPAATATFARSLSDWPAPTAESYAAAHDQVTALAAGGPLASVYSGHPAFGMPPEPSLMVLAHYIDALDWARGLVRLRTILGGKSPHPQTFLMGGMAVAPEWGGPTRPTDGEHPWRAARHSPAPLSDVALSDISHLAGDARRFVSNVFLPDVMTVAAYYPEWENLGRASGHFLAFGEFPRDDVEAGTLTLPRGRVMDHDPSWVGAVDPSGVAESVSHAWYDYRAGTDELLFAGRGQTAPHYLGPRPPYTTLEDYDHYSWVKAPRYADDPFETGALARLLVAYGVGSADARSGVDRATHQLNGGMDGMFGTLGRLIGRAIEAVIVAERMEGWLRELVANLSTGDLAVTDLSAWDPATWPAEASGFGLAEGVDGAIGHWVTIRDRHIADYQVVAGSTWNVSPRDARGRRGPCEQALLGTPIADEARPLEALRTIHSFAPCLACAVH
jgi:[NiFe] hydrogenase large subunit/hydrogenase large subunit